MTLEVVQWNQFQHDTMEIPRGLGGALVQLLSSSCYSVGKSHNLPPTQGDCCDKINSTSLCVLTRLLTSLPTPGHMNLSVTRASVLFVPKWPEVRPLWHSLSNRTLSFLSRINRTCRHEACAHNYLWTQHTAVYIGTKSHTSFPSFFL